MRDWLMLGVLAILVPLGLSNTLIAYLLWGWTAVWAPNTWMYGFMQPVQYNLIFAVIALGRMLMYKEAGRRPYVMTPTAILFLMLGFHGLLSATFAYEGLPRNWELSTNLLKALLFCLVMPIILTNRFRLHLMVLFIVIGLSFHGFIDGLKVISSGGAHHVQGNPKLGDNNHFAVAIAMILPLMLYLANYSAKALARTGFIMGAIVALLSIIGTQSRGGFLSLAIMAIWMAVTSRRKVLSFGIVLAIAAAIVAFAPASWTERMDTIQTADQDSSFMGRVIAWRAGSAVALASPFFGGGFHAAQTAHVWERFKDSTGLLGFVSIPEAGYAKAAHSIYFEVLGDLGFVGLLLFLLIVFRPFVNHWQIGKYCRKAPQGWQWAHDMSGALVASMLAYAVGGASISAAYFEVMYMFVMMSEIIRLQLKQHIDANPANRTT